jgi:Protein of unknown function (DUF3040)
VARSSNPKIHYRRRFVESSLGFLAGVASLAAGTLLTSAWLSVSGFGVTLLGTGWAIATYRRVAGLVIA